MRKIIAFLLVTVSLFALGCGDDKKAAPKNESKKIIKVGTTAGPQAQILEAVKPVLAKEGIEMQIVEFNDFATPNEALNQGELDANSFQHKPYLDTQIKARKYELNELGKTILMPMAVYSKKIKSLDEIKEGFKVAIPNDPSNGGRALLLLQELKLIKLDSKAGILPTPSNIIENPKNLKITEVEAAQAPRVLDDVDLVAINTNYALGVESKNSPYACIIVARTKDKDRPELQKLVKAYQSPELEKFITETFKGSIVRAW